MTVTEESRHRLHQKLDQTIGEEDATTLMEHLPPADVATKQDLAHLRTQIDANVDHRCGRLDHKIDVVDGKFAVVGERFNTIETLITSLGSQVTELGKRIDGFDRRVEAQAARADLLFWQFLGAILAVSAIVFTAVKLFGG